MKCSYRSCYRYALPWRSHLFVVGSCLLGYLMLLPACGLIDAASAQVLTEDTVWSGTVILSEDLLIPRGVTLKIRAGTVVKIIPAESTKTDPEYISPLTEITIRGTLQAEGIETAAIAFAADPPGSAGRWSGLLVDGGTVSLRSCRIQDAENGLQVFSGRVDLDRVTLKGNRYGLVAQGTGSRVKMVSSVIRDNDYGQLRFAGAEIASVNSSVTANRKKDVVVWDQAYADAAKPDPYRATQTVARVYGDEVLLGETVWQGRIEVEGQVRIPETARLVILPGTVVEFRRRDTNGDGIGENGLLIQGVLVAKGSRAEPIRFRSAESTPRIGDWDAINLMNSDSTQNLIEYCRIEDSYRGLHFHFSNVYVSNSQFRNSYRGIQFQESQVELRNNLFVGNKSAVQGRNADLLFSGNQVLGNLRGVNFFRTSVTVSNNRFSGNLIDGLRIRDSGAIVERNIFDGNRYGMMAQDSIYGHYAANLVAGNAELGFSLKNIDNLEVSGNYVSGNGLNGMSLQDLRAMIRGNSFTDNGERGLGIISFDGEVTGNNFAANGLYAIDLEGAQDLAAPGNWWGGDPPEKVIFDRLDQTGRGKVKATDPVVSPLPYLWPLREIPLSLVWRGELLINATSEVPSGTTLRVAPGSKIRMGKEVSLLIRGRLLAKGEKGQRISFTSSSDPLPGAWGELLLERATGSTVEFCDFKAATWGLHSHFTNLSIAESRFIDNHGGLRFRSGPVTISRSLFRGNEIGIRSYRGIASISGNTITENETGIFVREKGGGLEIKRNNLAGNKGYAIRIGDFNDEDVKAVENWWGGEPGPMIFDARQESGIGFVRFEPVLTVPVKTGPEE